MEAYVVFARSKEAVRFEEQEEEDIGCASSSFSTSSSDEVELADDASSSGSTGHFEMASLMTQLPIKRGLSKFFDGKSQSFASLAAVGGLEDLPKPPPPAKRLKTSRSCGVVGLKDAHRARLTAAGKKQATRARLARGRPLLVSSSPVRPAAVAGQPLLFA